MGAPKNLVKKQEIIQKSVYFNLLFFKRHSNIFLVVSGDKFEHITTLTGGIVVWEKKKKRKKLCILYLWLLKNY